MVVELLGTIRVADVSPLGSAHCVVAAAVRRHRRPLPLCLDVLEERSHADTVQVFAERKSTQISERPADCPALSHIARSAKAHWGYPDDWLKLWRDELEFTQASLERHAVFCAVRAREIIGVYALSLAGREAELEDLWVLPAHMRQGVGRRLLSHAAGLARARGASRMRIASDPNAEPFYLERGAVRSGSVPSRPAGRQLPLLYLEL